MNDKTKKKVKKVLKGSLKKNSKKIQKKRKRVLKKESNKEEIRAQIESFERENISYKKQVSEHLKEFFKQRDWSFVTHGQGERAYRDLASRLTRTFKKRSFLINEEPKFSQRKLCSRDGKKFYIGRFLIALESKKEVILVVRTFASLSLFFVKRFICDLENLERGLKKKEKTFKKKKVYGAIVYASCFKENFSKSLQAFKFAQNKGLFLIKQNQIFSFLSVKNKKNFKPRNFNIDHL